MSDIITKVDLRKFTDNVMELKGFDEREIFETVMKAKKVEDLLSADITAEQVFSCMKNIKTLSAQLEEQVLTAENMFNNMKSVISSGKRKVLL